jgi:hypothetical protein
MGGFVTASPEDIYRRWLPFGVKAEHGVAVVGILAADVEDGMARREVDGRQEDARTACLTGTLYNGIAVLCKFFAIKVAVGIDVIHVWNLMENLGSIGYLLR